MPYYESRKTYRIALVFGESRRFPGGGLPGRGLPGRLIPAGVFPAVTYPSRGYPGGDYSRQSVCRQPDLKAGTFFNSMWNTLFQAMVR